MKRKQKPIHRQASELGLPAEDARELQLFREFLRQPVQNEAAYRRVYGESGLDKPAASAIKRELFEGE